MAWNCRVVKEMLDDGNEFFSIREVFYNSNGGIYGYTEDAVDISGDTIEGIRKYLQWCLDCLDKPILINDEVKFEEREE